MRKVSKDNIASIIKERIDNFELNIDVNESGKIVSYANGVAEVYGIKNVIAGELVEFENNERGLVSFVGESSSSVVIVGKGDDINKGMLCSRTNKQILLHDTNNNILNKEYKKMNKKNMLTLAATSALAGGFLGDILGGKRKTVSDIRCKEKKVAKRRAKNKNKKKR